MLEIVRIEPTLINSSQKLYPHVAPSFHWVLISNRRTITHDA
nr:MAG TPA: hypothetical protein [Caudoviricetes sp.]